MANEIFKQIFEHLQKNNKDSGNFIILNENQKIPIDQALFKTDFTETNKKIAFVDGGNGELLSAPNFSLQFIRVYGSIFSGSKIVKRELQEFYAVVNTTKKEGKIVYEAKTFNSNFEINLDFDLNDSTLASQNHAVKPSAIAEAIRKFAEIKMAAKMCDYLEQEDVLVKDGELMPRLTFETKFTEELFILAKNKNINLCGLSKTTTLLTDTGNSAIAALNNLNSEGIWQYLPEQNSEIKIGFVKLAKKTNYAFRIDLLNANAMPSIFSLLSKNSTDPSFLGYPYGLVEADLRARVSREECSSLRIHFLTKFGEPFKQNLSAIDAHDILNVIR